MNEKRNPRLQPGASTANPCEGVGSTVGERLANVKRVAFYPGGVKLESFHGAARTGPKNPSKRGKVVGWSRQSRARFRLEMLIRRPPDGYVVHGVTLTIPGAVLPVAQSKRLFKDFQLRAMLNGWSGFWRLEIQQRGQLHWHCILATPPDRRSVIQIRELWQECIIRLGPYDTADHPKPVWERDCEGRWMQTVGVLSSRMALPRSDRKSCDVRTAGSDWQASWKWLYYLQDHATKRKQCQVGENVGRHWGYINKPILRRAMPLEVSDLSTRQYGQLLKWIARMVTPQLPRVGVPFGRRLGFTQKRGRYGKTVWFVNPATIKRMVSFLLANDAPKVGQRGDVVSYRMESGEADAIAKALADLTPEQFAKWQLWEADAIRPGSDWKCEEPEKLWNGIQFAKGEPTGEA